MFRLLRSATCLGCTPTLISASGVSCFYGLTHRDYHFTLSLGKSELYGASIEALYHSGAVVLTGHWFPQSARSSFIRLQKHGAKFSTRHTWTCSAATSKCVAYSLSFSPLIRTQGPRFHDWLYACTQF